MTTLLRVALIAVPRLLADMLRGALTTQPDIEVVADVNETVTAREIFDIRPDVVIVSTATRSGGVRTTAASYQDAEQASAASNDQAMIYWLMAKPLSLRNATSVDLIAAIRSRKIKLPGSCNS
jgi:hypothetical protein